MRDFWLCQSLTYRGQLLSINLRTFYSCFWLCILFARELDLYDLGREENWFIFQAMRDRELFPLLGIPFS